MMCFVNPKLQKRVKVCKLRNKEERLRKGGMENMRSNMALALQSLFAQWKVFGNNSVLEHCEGLDIQEFRNLMDSAKGGVMLVSMGSIAASSRMPMSIKNAFVSSFRAFPNVSFSFKSFSFLILSLMIATSVPSF